MKKSIFVTFLYAVVVLICILHHEIWSDEAQVWLLTKNISFFGLFKHLVNEGHPSLFYLLVMPFSKLSDNIFWMQLICFFSCVMSVFLIWQYTKFSTPAKIVLTLSSPFIYHFPVIARSYSLVPLLLVSLGILYYKSKKHPVLYAVLIAALSNLHAIMFPFAVLLGGYFIYKNLLEDKNKSKIFLLSYGIILFGFLALVVQLSGTTDSNIVINFKNPVRGLDAFVRSAMLFLYNSFDDYIIKSSRSYFTVYPLTMLILTISAHIFALIAIFKQNKKLFIFAIIAVLSQLGIYTFAYCYFIFPTRIYCAYMIILFCFILLMQSQPKKNLTNAAIILLFGLTFINGFKSYYGDLLFDYTPSKKTAQFLHKNIDPQNSLVFISDYGSAIAVNYYLNGEPELLNVRTGKPLKYVVWKRENISIVSEEYLSKYFRFLRKTGNKKNLYILMGTNPFLAREFYKTGQSGDYDLVYISGNSVVPLEMFQLYKFKH